MDRLNSLFSLEDRVALVTGGTRGVGAMIARGLLMAGARVIISGRDAEAGRATVASLLEFGRCEFQEADLSLPNGPEMLAAAAIERAPDLNVLVNNAGITDSRALGEWGRADFDAVMGLNVTAPFLLVQALHPLLKRNASSRRPSHILNTGSIAGLTTSSGSHAYGPSKAALHHLTKMLAQKLAADHIRVNAVAPGLFASSMTAEIVEDEASRNATVSRTPVGRMGEPDDLAVLVIAILNSGYMTGNVIPLDGGLAL